jgi:hypothetical protein
MENKQTAIEWLYNNIIFNPITIIDIEYNEETFVRAKIMEKEQIIDAANHGVDFENSPYKTAEEYYNETYEQ